MRISTTILGIGLALQMAACGGMSEDDARRAFTAMNTAASSGRQKVENDARKAQTVDNTVDASFPCLEGGTMSFSGTFDDSQTNAFQFDFDTSFAACKSQGVTIDGTMGYAMSMSGATGAESFAYSMVGKLQFAGEVDGECDMDLEMTFANQALTYSGSICGHEAGELMGAGMGY